MTDDLARPGRHAALSSVARSLAVSSGLVLAYYLLPMDAPLNGGTVTGLVLGLLAVTALFLWEVRTIVRSPHPELRAVESLAVLLPLFVLLFATSYHLLERSAHGSFTESLTRTDALYFTLTVVSTVGFGDITARTETARVMTMIQIVGGILLVGIAARVVVRAVEAGRRRRDPENR
jgi:4-amino-4-deoxy-L-arabinose transferase-like glycosyltransferase